MSNIWAIVLTKSDDNKYLCEPQGPDKKIEYKALHIECKKDTEINPEWSCDFKSGSWKISYICRLYEDNVITDKMLQLQTGTCFLPAFEGRNVMQKLLRKNC